jgi:hypothetical protein
MNVRINGGSRFTTAIRVNALRYPLVLGNSVEIQLPAGTSVMFRGQEYRLGLPVQEDAAGVQVRRVVPVPAHPRQVTLDAGIEYSLADDELGLLKAIDRRQSFVFQTGTEAHLPAGTCLHNDHTCLELREGHTVILN